MMRKIKFRAQEKESKEWIYGAYQSSTPDKLFATYPHDLPFEMIVPETVGEYTEMLDSNNKNIWEDDILENQNNNTIYKRSRVIKRNGTWMVVYPTRGFTSLWWALENGKLVIIGNAHNNPELVEGWKE